MLSVERRNDFPGKGVLERKHVRIRKTELAPHGGPDLKLPNWEYRVSKYGIDLDLYEGVATTHGDRLLSAGKSDRCPPNSGANRGRTD